MCKGGHKIKNLRDFFSGNINRIVFPAAAMAVGVTIYKVRKRRSEYDEDEF